MTLIAPFSAAFQAANGPHGGLPLPPSPWAVHGLGAVPADRVWGDSYGPGFVLQPGQVGTLQLALPAGINLAEKRGALEAEAERLGIWTRDLRANGLGTVLWWQLGPRDRPVTSDALGMVASHAITTATGVKPSFVNMPGAPTASQPLGQTPSMLTPWSEKTTWQKISNIASLVMVPVAAWHGYKRNNSIGWALGWALLGGVAPFVTGAIMVAQGPGKRANAGRRRRKHRARRHNAGANRSAVRVVDLVDEDARPHLDAAETAALYDAAHALLSATTPSNSAGANIVAMTQSSDVWPLPIAGSKWSSHVSAGRAIKFADYLRGVVETPSGHAVAKIMGR